MKAIILVLGVLVAGCAATPEKLESVGKAESARLAPPVKRLSSFANYELKSMVLSAAVQSDSAKVQAAERLESTLKAKLQPLLDQWNTQTSGDRSGTLVVQPRLESLRVVSGGARFWAGAFAGDSTIDIDLAMTDDTTGQQVAKPRITLKADAMTGGWSIGKSDENLLDYIASVAYEYMMANY
jgi:hypothetical protein